MNRPDPNSADQSANNDDESVWLDLVARLEATESSVLDGDPPGEPDASGERKTFRDFDPLGLTLPTVIPEQKEPGPGHEPASDASAGPRDYSVEDDDDGAFVPEEPPSLAGTEPLTMLAWLGAVGGPLALLFTAMFWRTAPLAAILGIVAAFVVSVVYLIMRLPREKNEDDDGARI